MCACVLGCVRACARARGCHRSTKPGMMRLHQLPTGYFVLIQCQNQNPRELIIIVGDVYSRRIAIATVSVKAIVEYPIQVGKWVIGIVSPESRGVEGGIERLNCC